MSNNYFQFKQFRISQGECAMKVTTEGCLFGALIDPADAVRILDIGAGTGLLSLMLAQKTTESMIDAVEIDPQAAAQAQSNFENCQWSERLSCSPTSIQYFLAPEKYDLVVSNPPFFKESLKGSSQEKNVAKHEKSLNQADLLNCIDRLLTSKGRFWVLYPEMEAKLFAELAAKKGYYAVSNFRVFDKPGSKVIRVIQQFARGKNENAEPQEFYIKKGSGDYTDAFISLLSPYYLHL